MLKKLLFLFLVLSHNLYALDLSITDKAAEAYLHGEYNRGIDFSGSFSFIGDFEINNIYSLRGGFLLGRAGEVTDLRFFTTAGASPFSEIPLSFSLSWIYNGLPEYKAHTNSILPIIAFGTDRAGGTLGLNFRFTSFFNEAAQFEMIWTALVYFNFINNDKLRFGINLANYDDFYAKNLGAVSLNFDAVIRITDNLQIINKIEIMQSGIDGLTANFYGIAWKGGVRFSW